MRNVTRKKKQNFTSREAKCPYGVDIGVYMARATLMRVEWDGMFEGLMSIFEQVPREHLIGLLDAAQRAEITRRYCKTFQNLFPEYHDVCANIAT